MAYTAWSVVYGEQPTAAKWNQLGTNDAGFKDGTNIDNDAIINRHLANNAADTTNIDNSQQAFIINRLNTASASSTGWLPFPTDTTVASNGCTITSGYRVTVPRAGRYNAGLVMRYASGTDGTRGLRMTLYRGGSLVESQGAGVFLVQPPIISSATMFDCLAGDEIRFEMYTSGSFTPTAYSNMASGADRAFVNRLWVCESRV